MRPPLQEEKQPQPALTIYLRANSILQVSVLRVLLSFTLQCLQTRALQSQEERSDRTGCCQTLRQQAALILRQHLLTQQTPINGDMTVDYNFLRVSCNCYTLLSGKLELTVALYCWLVFADLLTKRSRISLQSLDFVTGGRPTFDLRMNRDTGERMSGRFCRYSVSQDVS